MYWLETQAALIMSYMIFYTRQYLCCNKYAYTMKCVLFCLDVFIVICGMKYMTPSVLT